MVCGTTSPPRPGAGDWNRPEAMRPRASAKVPGPRRMGAPVRDAALTPGPLHLPRTTPVAPLMRSPDFVQVSTAAAITLGLAPGALFGCSCTRCLNLLLTYPEGCRANCAYCGLARHREAASDYADRNFIRVDWPALPVADLIDRVADNPDRRCCISLTPEDSLCESMRLHGLHEQTTSRPLSHDELVQLQRIASEAGFPADLGRQGDDLARAA